MQKYSLFFISSPAFNICGFFDDGPFWPVWGDTHCSFEFHLINNWCWTFFMWFLAICMSCLETVCLSLRRTSVQFLIEFAFLILSYMNCLYIWGINSLSIASFAIVFSYSESCLFILFVVSFAVQKVLSLIRSHFKFFLFLFSLL